jgi:hypothetical protein
MNRLGRQAALLACGLLAALALTPSTARAADDEKSGWVSLFDGKTLSGWESLELPNQKQPSKWEVVDGTLVGSGGQSMIFSPKGGYKNFKFRAEVKINDKGNSGMYFRTPKGNTFMNGYECQINSTHADPIRSGSIYTFVHLFDDSNPPKPNTFFTQEVDVQDVNFRGKIVTRIRVSIDGKLLYEFNDFAQTWKDGHFAFQQHDPGSKVTIRKIEVMELPESK